MNRTILVMDDDRIVRRFLCEALGIEGYEVLAAASLETAMAMLSRQDKAVDLVIMDVMAPSLTGSPVAAALKEQGLPVLYLSGFDRDSLLAERKLDRDAAFLQKPFTVRDLILKVSDLMPVKDETAG